MALKQKILSLSLAASTLLGAGLSAQDKTPEKQSETQPVTTVQPAAATQAMPEPGEALTKEQKALVSIKLALYQRQIENSYKREFLSMERREVRKLMHAKRAYKRLADKVNRAIAKGNLSKTDIAGLQGKLEQAHGCVDLYEKMIDETIKKQADEIQKRYDKDLKEIDQMIQDVKDGKMPKIRKPEPKKKTLLEKYSTRITAAKDR